MQAITEESKVHQQWYVDAKAMTVETLPAFIQKLTTEYHHDYGTICHAIAAAGIAAMWAVERAPCGGITGFQGGAITWQVLQHWQGIQGPARIVEFDLMRFPQYESKFAAIPREAWEHLQKKAAADLAGGSANMHPNVVAHMESIVAGSVPFGYRIED
ncbi:hypothetical protein [Cupriavidus nantongensis]|uniref:Uncharacterized protein n=1 Tax=Cupriavidus nantongensis TaxID=1796606 RepID=A0A142JHS0_9BURK|nr:hypothetical protein [Cupriavidus nantongensis]AMR77632.1 hypothetical protein A2G96_07730 [Cupriavidus nantongensis]